MLKLSKRIITTISLVLIISLVAMPAGYTYAAAKKGICVIQTFRLYPDIYGTVPGVVTPDASDKITFNIDMKSKITNVNVKQKTWGLNLFVGYMMFVPDKQYEVKISGDTATIKTYWKLDAATIGGLSKNIIIMGYKFSKALAPTTVAKMCIQYTLKNDGTVTYKRISEKVLPKIIK